MLSKSQIKFINGLRKKKQRTENQLFIVEGIKAVEDMILSKMPLHQLYATSLYNNELNIDQITLISEKELKMISQFSTPNQILAIFKIPQPDSHNHKDLTLVLDDINDPGNLGTIIRLCDWYDTNLICSKNTVDCYNPKVVQATMGSIARVNICYQDLSEFLNTSERPIYGAVLNGSVVYQTSLPQKAILIMGNEANGISSAIEKYVQNPITIPQFGKNQNTESLNVATATAILCSEFKRFL